MSPSALFNVIALAVAAGSAVAQETRLTYPATPLASKTFSYPSGIPYKVDTDEGLIRGVQAGYNQCNQTTETQESLCQTAFFNSIDDFCLWAPIHPNSTVGNVEGEMVAWCSKPGHGTRLIPEGTLTGLQFLKTPDYIQLVGFMDQTKINLADGDYGGEMDPHGADLRGNPMGGIMFSNAWGEYKQVVEWTNFLGLNAFCFKACNPAGPNAAQWCQHIYDRIGCAYNAPNAAQNNVFEQCDADNGDFPGIYTDASGATVTYQQPPESLGVITSMPYTAKLPASSNCVTYTSSALFTGLPKVSTSASASSGSATATASGSAKTTAVVKDGVTQTGTAANSQATDSGAETLLVSGFATVMGVVFAGLFLAYYCNQIAAVRTPVWPAIPHTHMSLTPTYLPTYDIQFVHTNEFWKHERL